MVGEIRDLETLEMVTQASLTGHLILSVLHTPDATSALIRLLDIGIEPFLAAATLTGVIGQRLVRKICPACRQPYQPEEGLLNALGFTASSRPKEFVHGTGCEACAGTGYQERTSLFEVLTMNEPLAQMLIRREPESALRARALELSALWPFVADARAKVAEGLTTVEGVDRVLPDPDHPGVG
jgi:type II secretory ATPase GspE/PulE/Tfp pilus assembly ATPase PilB-like protein